MEVKKKTYLRLDVCIDEEERKTERRKEKKEEENKDV
jgi:hypothetical protein